MLGQLLLQAKVQLEKSQRAGARAGAHHTEETPWAALNMVKLGGEEEAMKDRGSKVSFFLSF